MKPLKYILSLTLLNWLLLLGLQFFEILLRGHVDTPLWLALTTLTSFKVLVPHLPLGVFFALLSKSFLTKHSDTRQFLLSCGLQFATTLGFEFWILHRLQIEVSGGFYLCTLVGAGLILLLSTQRTFKLALASAPLVVLALLIGFNHFTAAHPEHSLTHSNSPNVLFILVDTLREDHASFNGYPRRTTPHLETLAQQSTVFTNTVSTSSWTKPAIASLFTAKNLIGDPIHTRHDFLKFDGVKMGELFTKAGYDTAFFSANPFASSFFGVTTGFQHIIEPAPNAQHPFNTYTWPRLLNFYGHIPKFLMLNNARIRLQWFLDELKIRSIADLKSFVVSRPQSGQDERNDRYAKQLRPILELHDNLFTSLKDIPEWQREWLHPFIKSALNFTLKFSYVRSQNATGDVIVDHWITNVELPQHVQRWLETKSSANKPFFAYVHFMGPHDPYFEQPPQLIPQFGSDSMLDIESPPFKHIYPSIGAPEPKPEELQSLIDNYDHALAVTDQNIGKLLEMFKTRNALDNTIIVFTSDHGEAFYDHKIYDHMYSLHRELVNIPLFISWPNKISTQTTAVPATLVDIYPTLSKLTGITFPNQAADGQILFDEDFKVKESGLSQRVRVCSVQTGKKPPKPLWLNDVFAERKKSDEPVSQAWLRMVLQGTRKLIVEWESPNFKTTPHTETVFFYPTEDAIEARVPVDLTATPDAQSLLQQLLSQSVHDITF